MNEMELCIVMNCSADKLAKIAEVEMVKSATDCILLIALFILIGGVLWVVYKNSLRDLE